MPLAESSDILNSPVFPANVPYASICIAPAVVGTIVKLLEGLDVPIPSLDKVLFQNKLLEPDWVFVPVKKDTCPAIPEPEITVPKVEGSAHCHSKVEEFHAKTCSLVQPPSILKPSDVSSSPEFEAVFNVVSPEDNLIPMELSSTKSPKLAPTSMVKLPGPVPVEDRPDPAVIEVTE